MRWLVVIVLAGCGRVAGDSDNQAPILEVDGPATSYGTTPVNLTVTAEDPDDDPVTVAATSPVGRVTRTATGFTFVPPFGHVGNISIEITARDDSDATSTETYTLEVVVRASCVSIRDSGFSTGSGVYELQTQTGFVDVFCDMVTEGGGWTLLAKIPPLDARFAFNGPWTAAPVTPISEGTLDLSPDGALWSLAAGSVGFTEVKVAFDTTVGLRSRNLAAGAQQSLVGLLATSAVVETNARAPWIAVVGGSAPGLQANCNQAGFSLSQNRGVRIGFQANEQTDCLSPDSAIGVGIELDVPELTTVSGVAGCSPAASCNDSPDPQLGVFGFVLVR